MRCHQQDRSAARIPLDLLRSCKAQGQGSVRGGREWRHAALAREFDAEPAYKERSADDPGGHRQASSPPGSKRRPPGEEMPIFPRSLVYKGGWLHPDDRPPDAVVSLPKFTVRANGTIPYIQRLIKVPYQDDKWISALQVRAGNTVLLHHMGITEVALPDGVTPEVLDVMDTVASQIGAPSGKLQIQQRVVADPANPEAYDMLGVYTPGTTFETYGEGNGKLLKSGKNVYLNFNIHYTTTDREGDRPVPARTLVPVHATGACAYLTGRRLPRELDHREWPRTARRRSRYQGGGHRLRDTADTGEWRKLRADRTDCLSVADHDLPAAAARAHAGRGLQVHRHLSRWSRTGDPDRCLTL